MTEKMTIIDKEPKGITMHNYKKEKEIIVKVVRWKQKILTIIDEKKQNNNKEIFFSFGKERPSVFRLSKYKNRPEEM